MEQAGNEVRPSREIAALLDLMARLRTPESGCPWDLRQTFATIAPYTIEEAYEVADAIARGDLTDLKDELGDLLLQVVFHARMAEEQGAFDFGDVVRAITDKLIRRHPHVFGDLRGLSPDDVKKLWETIKADERKARGNSGALESALDAVPLALPALTRAEKIQKRVARIGFDWPDVEGAMQKLHEEIAEVRTAASDKAREEEIGDLLFAAVNVARKYGQDPETALRAATIKFERRFRAVEQACRDRNRKPDQFTLEELETFWQQAKTQDKQPDKTRS